MSGGLPADVRLANEIAAEFAHLDPADGAARVAKHIHTFWEPRMLRAVLSYKDSGGTDLDPMAAAAIEQLRQPA